LPAACGGGDSGEESAAAPGAEAGDPATDKLAQVVARGTLTLSTDLRYPPQSFAVKGAKRAPGSRCPANQLTAPQVVGYDADTGELVAKALGVEPCLHHRRSDDQAVDDRALPGGGDAGARSCRSE
jgi:ABC-type amino acid transport substrate-binding protein